MKKLIKSLSLFLVMLLIVGCSQSVERSDRTITLIQDNMTNVINVISEIQFNEQELQQQFESMINSEQELQAFANEEASIYQNIQTRQELMKKLDEHRNTLADLRDEIKVQAERNELPSDQVQQVDQLMEGFVNHLEVYTTDYQANLTTEKQLYQSMANPDLDYTQFFNLFDKISVLTTNNQMNLEKVIELVEPINTILINLKVHLANIQEAS
ncbi:YkyA family protein [Aerococcaceae bacterium DSM 111020]|nr:YkyA family protein [Aerococcaceae bacterium DSM 111020]